MRAYGIQRKDVHSLEWWAGSKSSTGNKTKSPLKRRSRLAYKKIGRAKAKESMRSEFVGP